jgi:hypothetical protein
MARNGFSQAISSTPTVVFTADTDGGRARSFYVECAVTSAANLLVTIPELHGTETATLRPGQGLTFTANRELGSTRIPGIGSMTLAGSGGTATATWILNGK